MVDINYARIKAQFIFADKLEQILNLSKIETISKTIQIYNEFYTKV